jgi:hypothetical protein
VLRVTELFVGLALDHKPIEQERWLLHQKSSFS